MNPRITELYKKRPKNWFLRINFFALSLLSVVAWLQLDVDWNDVFSARRLENLRRFGNEIYPFSLRNEPFRISGLLSWSQQVLAERGYRAAATTFGISVVAIIVAGASALIFVFPAARNIATTNPFIPDGANSSAFHVGKWKTVVILTRGWFIVSRAIPEYIWAFLLIGIIGPGAWPAILALAIHNFGILGKLGAEVVENVDASTPAALRSIGLSRRQIYFTSIVPASFTKWLLFFFYRWETCIREATVLGMLGISSIGFWVRESRARDWYDEMFFFILLSAALVLIVDLVSAFTRYAVRNA